MIAATFSRNFNVANLIQEHSSDDDILLQALPILSFTHVQ